MQLQQVALMDIAVIDAEVVVIRPTFVRHIRAPTDEGCGAFGKARGRRLQQRAQVALPRQEVRGLQLLSRFLPTPRQ